MRNVQPKKLVVLTLSTRVAMVLAAVCVAILPLPGTSSADDTESICHFREGSLDWELKLVGPNAATDHLTNHANDGVPGGAVPGADGFVFDAECQPMADVACDDWVACGDQCDVVHATALGACEATRGMCIGFCEAAFQICTAECGSDVDCHIRCEAERSVCVTPCQVDAALCGSIAEVEHAACLSRCDADFPTCADSRL